VSNNVGTLITAPVRPQSSADTYPTAYATDLLGGHQQFALLAERDAIPAERRQEGMTVWVVETATLYVLSGGIDNVNWTPFSGGGGGGGASTFVFVQALPLADWNVVHGLNQFPAVITVDSTGAQVEGDVTYVNANEITVSFAGPFSGIAYLN
jgi:hypothetical protein